MNPDDPRRLAHSLRNALYPILFYPELLASSLHDPSRARVILEKWGHASRRMYQQIDDFLLAWNSGALEPADARALCASASALPCWQEDFPGVQLTTTLQDSLIPVSVPSAAFLRMLVQLLDNAFRAAAAGNGPAHVLLSCGMDARCARIAIHDSGHGPETPLPLDSRGRLSSSATAGVGLLLASRVIQRCRGRFSSTSNSEGFSVTIQLPIHKSPS